MKGEFLGDTRAKDLLGTINYKDFQVSKVDQGVSTDVYRLEKEGTIHYLRILPKGVAVSAEVLAHKLLLGKGVRVPVVESYEDFNPELGSSYMIVQDIGGSALETQIKEDSEHNIDSVLVDAGKDLAQINSVPVSGFGKFVKGKPGQTKLEGKKEDYETFILSKFEAVMKLLEEQNVLDTEQREFIKNKITQNRELLQYDEAVLAHGDLGLYHIFSEGDEYKGIIDFGSMRGASPYYDLAYFRFRAGTKHLLKLIEGYQTVKPLPADYNERIEVEGLIIAVEKLGWSLSKRGKDSPRFKKAKKMLQEYLDSMTL